MNNLPTGTVTFLFTDIEGSTKIAQQYPQQWETLRARHHAILHQAMQAHDGHVFQIIGDAFCVAFHTAIDALNAAVLAQRLLVKEPWNPAPIKVRMGINTGTAQITETDSVAGGYTGYTSLVRVQRVMSVAYGGQILLSNTSAELARLELPQDLRLLDLKEHRLKGILNPEHFWQVAVPDLPHDFPPLQSLNAIPNNLPLQLTSFIGREKEQRELKELLEKTRLLSLTGAGGTGKTRLVLQVAADLIDEFPDGVWFIELGPLADPALVPHSVATAIGLQLETGRTIQAALTEYLREKKCLLLLDNCEHLIDACARLADLFLHTCPKLKLLTTSREALGIAGEVSYRVPSLAIPTLETQSIDTLTQYEAVRLFIDRAVTLQPNFAVTNQNAPAVAQICYRLDGIPLAIELAATRVNILSVEQISERLNDRLRLLTGGSRTALPRHQTLRAAIDWSYSLLSPSERILFERLSLFAGGWTLEAAESICAKDGIASCEVLDLLQYLAGKSLIGVDESGAGWVRYRMLETIRQYASEKLINSGQARAFRDHHLNWFLNFAEEAYPKLFRGEQGVILDRLEAEHDNFRTALAWSMETGIEKGLRLATGLSRFWMLRGYWFERLDWFKKLLAHPGSIAPTSARAYALVKYGGIENSQGEISDAEKSYAESLQIFRQLDDSKGIAEMLGELARLSIQQGDLSRAGELSQESLEIYRKTGNKFQICFALNRLAQVRRAQGDRTKANELLKESETLLTEKDDREFIPDFRTGSEAQDVYYMFALSARDQGNFERAKRFFEDGLVFSRKTGNPHEIAWFLRHSANLAYRERDLPRAQTLYQESLQIVQNLKDKHCIAHSLDGLAQVENGKGNYEHAATIARQALNLYEQIGSKRRIAEVQWVLGLALLRTDPIDAEQMFKSSLTTRNKLRLKSDIAELFEAFAKMDSLGRAFEPATQLFAAASTLRETIPYPMTPAEHAELDREINILRAEFGGVATFNAAWAEGQKMSLEQAIDLAMKEVGNEPAS